MAPSEQITVGRLLRDAREEHALSLEDICRETRVVKDYLEAVEADEFDRLPSKAFARGIIRSYADCVGLSADTMVARYDVSDEPKVRNEVEQDELPANVRQRQVKWESGWWIVPLFLFCILLLTTFMYKDNAPVGAPPRNATDNNHDPNASIPIQHQYSAVPSIVDKTDADQGPHPAIGQNTNADQSPQGVFLSIKSDRDNGLTITIDDALTQRYELKAGDLIEWKGARSITVDLESSDGISIEVNGKHLVAPSRSDGTVHLDLYPDSIQ